MAGLILQAFWMSVQEKSSVTVMEETWIVLLLFPRSQKAWQNQNYPNNVILHSDRGSQYTSSEYIAAAVRMGFRLSYSKKGCPFDNAPMESFHSVLKKEEVYLKHYSSFHEANIRLFDYINGFYNRYRIHSAINFLSPIQFENSLFYS